MDISSEAKKAYDAYQKVAERDFLHVTTTQLNVVYNVYKRMERDGEYREAVLSLGKGEPLDKLIEKYFAGYNNLHGLDITETLTVFEDPELTAGTYFIVTTEKEGVPCSPIELHAKDTVKVKARLYSRLTEQPINAAKLSYAITTDNGESFEGEATDTDTAEFNLSLDREGGIRFKIFYLDESGKPVIGSETAYGGVLFDIEKIKPTHKAPEDLVSFWKEEIGRMIDTDPLSEKADGYEGRVSYEYGIPEKNRFSLIRADKEYLDELRKCGVTTVGDEILDDFELYEVYLKAPGPCPATAYITLPKVREPKSLKFHAVYDGYSAHTPAPIFNKSAIVAHCTHHGYELKKPDKDYYNHLNGAGILGSYGRGNGKVNSDYKDIHDCYLLYMLIRNLQFIRFVSDPSLAKVIPGLTEAFSGDVELSGGSMGGYQTTAVGGLSELLRDMIGGFKVKKIMPNIPAFCNIAGPLDGRAPTGLHIYEEGCDYFDAAILASLVDADIHIARVGLGDETCPHTGIAAMVNNIPEGHSKDINYLQNSSHGYVMDLPLQRWYKFVR